MEQPRSTYCLDTSALINPWKKLYQPDMFGSIWDEHIPFLILCGEIVSSRQVLIELEKQEDDLCKWAQAHKEMFVDDVTARDVTTLMDNYEQLTKGNRNEADPFVIGHAMAATPKLTVVSEEGAGRANERKQNIPFICHENAVRYITFNAFLRETGWHERPKGA
jgi:hypothetical protein